MRVSRTKSLKRDADATARMMRRAGMRKVRIVGTRGFWTAIAQATLKQLATFASEEAHKEQGK